MAFALMASDQPTLTGRTAWVRNLATPVRLFVSTETGGAVVLVSAALAALLWVNSPWGETYEQVWHTELAFRIGGAELSEDLRHWINDGLMALFFLVVGLEIRRELDMGELRERRRVAIPVLAALGGMLVPALIYIAFNAGDPAVRGWGIVMATDTAFALGVLALVGPAGSMRARVFLLTLVIIDDIGALLVIAFAYTEDVSIPALLAAAGFFGAVLVMRFVGVRQSWAYVLAGIGMWFAMLESGVHPTIAGVALGLLATAYPPSRQDLQSAGALWRLFREQPTPEFAQSARAGVNVAISPNERLQHLLHPWTSYLIVPLFALANAGVRINAETLSQAARSPITIGIVVALVVGKLVGITGASWLASRRWLGGFPLTVGWPGVIGVATVAGIGFTVSLFIADLSFTGEHLAEAKLGILAASLLAALLGWIAFTVQKKLPQRMLDRAKANTAAPLLDLDEPVDPDRDHVRGSPDALVTMVEYGDYQCPHCGQAEHVIRELLADFGNELQYVFRHLPLTDVHRNAQLAAEAVEAAGEQGKYWEMHDLLFDRQDALDLESLHRYAEELELNLDEFDRDLRGRRHTSRIDLDVDSADRSGVAGTPTFFINGRRHYGAYDIDTLSGVVRASLGRRAK